MDLLLGPRVTYELPMHSQNALYVYSVHCIKPLLVLPGQREDGRTRFLVLVSLVNIDVLSRGIKNEDYLGMEKRATLRTRLLNLSDRTLW